MINKDEQKSYKASSSMAKMVKAEKKWLAYLVIAEN